MIPESLHQYKNKKIAVAMSGGVDSAVAALLLKQAGAKVRGVFMKNWDDNEAGEAGASPNGEAPLAAQPCHDKEDLISAAAAADTLGVELHTANFVAEYKEKVFAPFLAELRAGRTPNPDVLCNSEIKFSAFADYVRQNGYSAFATGHYARIGEQNARPTLRRAEDAAKDQTYFLHRLTAAQLAAAIFPLGAMHKADVRAAARAAGLGNWRRKDSVGICFIGERHFPQFLSRYIAQTPGDIVDAAGKKIGEHIGLPFYTIGQRRGLPLGDVGDNRPWFVARKCAKTNTLQVVNDPDHPHLFRREVQIQNPHWIAATPPPLNWVYSAKLRHQQTPDSCTLTAASETAATIHFPAPQRAATPGQYAVLYDGNTCLGGGPIADD